MKKNTYLRLHISFLMLLTLLVLLYLQSRAQQVPMASGQLDGSKVSARLWNGGDAFWDLYGNPRYEVPKGTGQHSAFAGSLWIGGVDAAGQTYVAAQSYRQRGHDYYAGPFRDGAAYESPRTVTFSENLYCNQGLKLPDGRVVFTTKTGFDVVSPSTGAVSHIYTPYFAVRGADPVYADGKVYSVFTIGPNPASDNYLMAWDTSMFTYTVVCPLAVNVIEPCLTALSTGSILIANYQLQVWNPGDTITTVMGTGYNGNGACSILFPGDSVLVIGGSSYGTTWYHHGTGAITAGPTMSVYRWKPAVTVLPTGGWMVGGSNIGSETEILNASATAFSMGPSFVAPMSECAASTTPAGNVIFRGEHNLQILRPGATAFELLELSFSSYSPRLTHMEGSWYLSYIYGSGYTYFNPDEGKIENASYQHVWKVNRSEVDEFLADFAAGTVDFANYPDIETWPGNGKWWAGEDYHLAPFVDVNGDGLYKPATQGDYPCITGEQMLWHVYHDDGPHTETDGLPMHVQVEQNSYVFDQSLTSCSDTFLDYSTFYHLELTNKSAIDYKNVYVGYFLDFDIGSFDNDLAGSDPSRNLAFAYNSTPFDSFAYGAYQPALGLQILRAPGGDNLDHFLQFDNDFSLTGNPEMPLHYYGYLQSIWKDGTDATEGCAGSPVSNFMFPGDGGWCGAAPTGCSEISAGTIAFDRRGVMSIGPIDLDAGETIEMDFAIHWAHSATAMDNLGAVCRLQEAADNISNWWKAQTFSCFDLTIGSGDPAPRPIVPMLFPNPNSGSFTLRWDSPLSNDELLSIRDAAGREVARKAVPSGTREVQLAEQLASGLYHVVCSNGSAVRMVVQ